MTKYRTGVTDKLRSTQSVKRIRRNVIETAGAIFLASSNEEVPEKHLRMAIRNLAECIQLLADEAPSFREEFGKRLGRAYGLMSYRGDK